MAELYRFFDGTQQDPRVYEAADFAEYFKELIRSGVFQGGDKLQVRSDQVGMKTYVTPGKAWLEGYFYKNTSDLYLEHNAAHASLDRIDRIILRLDRVARTIRLRLLTGVPDNTPVVPELTRTADVLELALAQVRITANSASISPARIADERYNESVCGIVTHLFEQVNTSDIFQQFQTAWENWFGEVQDTTNLVTRTEFLEYQERSVPIGAILMWSGAQSTIPEGWALCDGENGTPDLRDRFIVGAGSDYEVGDTGGTKSTTLTTDHMPRHDHGSGTLKTSTSGSHTHTYVGLGLGAGGAFEMADKAPSGPIDPDAPTSSAGSHSHSVSGYTSYSGSASPTPLDNRPPYYALAYIMKLWG